MAAPTHVQAVSAQSVGTATSLVSPSFASTGGNAIAVVWGDDGGATHGATPISDNKSNTWTSAVARAVATGSGAAVAMHYAKNIAGGSGHTVTLTATGAGFLCIAVEEMAGADTAAPLDQHPAAATSGGRANSHNANSITPTQANTLAVAGITHGGANNNTFAGTGTATVRTSQTSTTNEPIALSTDTRSTTSSITEGFDLTANDTVHDAVCVANFIGAASVTDRSPIAYGYSSN